MKKIKDNKTITIIFQIIKTVVTIFLTMTFLIILTQKLFHNKISFFGFRIFTVASGSMEPKYKIKDMLLVQDIKVDKIKVKDDLVYYGTVDSYQGKIITHQVIKIDKNTHNEFEFHTQGIANNNEDPVVKESQVIGIVKAKLHIISFINHVISNIYGFFFLIVVPIIVLIFLEILNVIEERKKLEDE